MTRWILKTWLIPLATILAAAGLKTIFPNESILHLGALFGGYAVLLLIAATLAGVNREMLRAEWATVRAMLKQ
jgi:hypothetical protein